MSCWRYCQGYLLAYWIFYFMNSLSFMLDQQHLVDRLHTFDFSKLRNASDWHHQFQEVAHLVQACWNHNLIIASDPLTNSGRHCRQGCWLRFFELLVTMAFRSLVQIGLARRMHQILIYLWILVIDYVWTSFASSELACGVCSSWPQHLDTTYLY